MKFTIASILSLAVVAIAAPVAEPGLLPGGGNTVQGCSGGTVSCCNGGGTSGLLGLNVQCLPISLLIGLSGNSCAQNTVCCSNQGNTMNGINIPINVANCTPLNVAA